MAQTPLIHPTALIDSRAHVADDVRIAAYAVINGDVTIGPGTRILEHCVINGSTAIGSRCRIGPGAYLGMDPQHLKFVPDENNPTWLVIGDDVTIRESCRIHRSIVPGRDHATTIGNGCFIMGAIHVAHDCVLEENVIIADGVLMGGHCHIGSRVFLGGGSVMHQFVRIGRLAIIAGNEGVGQDVPPFSAVRYWRLKGYNAIGCKRAGMDRKTVTALRAAFRLLATNRDVSKALAAIEEEVEPLSEVLEMCQFIRASKRGIIPSQPRSRATQEPDFAEADDDDASEKS